MQRWREETLVALRGGADDRTVELALKRELDRAIACIELCERYAIDPLGAVTVLPADPELRVPPD